MSRTFTQCSRIFPVRSDFLKLSSDIAENARLLTDKLRISESFDIIKRDISILGRQAFLLFIDGFAKDDIAEKLMEFFFGITDEKMLESAETFSENCVPYVEVTTDNDLDAVAFNVLSGGLILCIDGMDKCIVIDLRTYPQRETSEPDRDKVFRGSHDGFVEVLISNTALIRRRIRDPALTFKYIKAGNRSQTDIAVCYIDGKADKPLLKKIIEKLRTANVESLTMNQESLAEILAPRKFFNPFPKFKYSERPDTAAAQLLEGDIVILVDNAPSAMIIPATVFDIMEEANDYYLPPITGTYLRLSRFLITFITTFLTPTWVLLLRYPQWVPIGLRFILADAQNVPIFIQLLILEVGIDGLKLASLNTPNMLTTSLSMIGAIIVGDFAVESGWFSAQAMLYTALVAIANYAQPGFELSYALKFMRILLLLLTGIFGIWGYIAGIISIFLMLLCNKTVSGHCYLYPLIPFNFYDFKTKILRMRIKS